MEIIINVLWLFLLSLACSLAINQIKTSSEFSFWTANKKKLYIARGKMMMQGKSSLFFSASHNLRWKQSDLN